MYYMNWKIYFCWNYSKFQRLIEWLNKTEIRLSKAELKLFNTKEKLINTELKIFNRYSNVIKECKSRNTKVLFQTKIRLFN